MKPIELGSTIVAGIFGAIMLIASAWLISRLWASEDPTAFPLIAATGFVVGAGVQIGVRLTGVS